MSQNNHFFRIKSADSIVKKISKTLISNLEQGEVLWLLSGGSAIDVAVECSKGLNGANLGNLTISLVDERFGEVGHADSNWNQLLEAGFSLPGANLHPWLDGGNSSRTASKTSDFFNTALSSSAYKLALVGMGADGHIAGILPKSPAATSEQMVVAYHAGDYQRLTLGFSALMRLDEAFLYATGENKAGQLESLAAKNIDPIIQPAQIIKRLPSWWVYNDRIGEAI